MEPQEHVMQLWSVSALLMSALQADEMSFSFM